MSKIAKEAEDFVKSKKDTKAEPPVPNELRIATAATVFTNSNGGNLNRQEELIEESFRLADLLIKYDKENPS